MPVGARSTLPPCCEPTNISFLSCLVDYTNQGNIAPGQSLGLLWSLAACAICKGVCLKYAYVFFFLFLFFLYTGFIWCSLYSLSAVVILLNVQLVWLLIWDSSPQALLIGGQYIVIMGITRLHFVAICLKVKLLWRSGCCTWTATAQRWYHSARRYIWSKCFTSTVIYL